MFHDSVQLLGSVFIELGQFFKCDFHFNPYCLFAAEKTDQILNPGSRSISGAAKGYQLYQNQCDDSVCRCSAPFLFSDHVSTPFLFVLLLQRTGSAEKTLPREQYND